jgi:hypothetical protein
VVRRRLHQLVPFALAVLGGNVLFCCTVAFDLSSLESGCDESTEKRCDNRCVPLNDPETGCAEDGCAPCYAANGSAKCDSDNYCYMVDCLDFWDDCDDDPSNGCETNLATNPNHCRNCKQHACSVELPHAKPACLADPNLDSTCGIAECDVGYGHCDRNIENGCETNLLNNHENCGVCGRSCGVQQTCVNGRCTDAITNDE